MVQNRRCGPRDVSGGTSQPWSILSIAEQMRQVISQERDSKRSEKHVHVLVLPVWEEVIMVTCPISQNPVQNSMEKQNVDAPCLLCQQETVTVLQLIPLEPLQNYTPSRSSERCVCVCEEGGRGEGEGRVAVCEMCVSGLGWVYLGCVFFAVVYWACKNDGQYQFPKHILG